MRGQPDDERQAFFDQHATYWLMLLGDLAIQTIAMANATVTILEVMRPDVIFDWPFLSWWMGTGNYRQPSSYGLPVVRPTWRTSMRLPLSAATAPPTSHSFLESWPRQTSPFSASSNSPAGPTGGPARAPSARRSGTGPRRTPASPDTAEAVPPATSPQPATAVASRPNPLAPPPPIPLTDPESRKNDRHHQPRPA
jgi:hypothetical protein